MKLSELLEYIGVELLDDRTEMLEGVSDNIWSDDAIIRQLNEAQRVLCRRAWVLEDTDLTRIDAENNKVCQIQMVEDQTDYSFHKSILNIKSVRISDSEVDLLRVGYADNRLRNGFQFDDSSFWDVNSIMIEESGRPSRWSADMGTRILRVRQKPNGDTAALTLNLVVVRMPVEILVATNVEATPEVPEEYHMMLARAAAGRLLQHPTVDAALRTTGKEWLNEFESECSEARKDRERRQQSAPQMRFGGWASDTYRNGWS